MKKFMALLVLFIAMSLFGCVTSQPTTNTTDTQPTTNTTVTEYTGPSFIGLSAADTLPVYELSRKSRQLNYQFNTPITGVTLLGDGYETTTNKEEYLVVHIQQPVGDTYEITSLNLQYPNGANILWDYGSREGGVFEGRTMWHNIDYTEIYIPITTSETASGVTGSTYLVTNIKYMDGSTILDVAYSEGVENWIVLYIGYRPVYVQGADWVGTYDKSTRTIALDFRWLENPDGVEYTTMWVNDIETPVVEGSFAFAGTDPQQIVLPAELDLGNNNWLVVKFEYPDGFGGYRYLRGYVTAIVAEDRGAIPIYDGDELNLLDRTLDLCVMLMNDITLPGNLISFGRDIRIVTAYQEKMTIYAESELTTLVEFTESTGTINIQILDIDFQCDVLFIARIRPISISLIRTSDQRISTFGNVTINK